VSALLAHGVNVTLSVMLSKDDSKVDACTWYFMTCFFDTTLGVLFCYCFIMALEKLFYTLKIGKLQTGNYFKVITPEE